MKPKAIVILMLIALAVLLGGYVGNAQQKPTNPPPPKAKPAEPGKSETKPQETQAKPAVETKDKKSENTKPEAKPAPKPETPKVQRRVRRIRPHYTEREPNNTNTSANVIKLLTITGRISPKDPEDWFKLIGQESDVASFELTTTGKVNLGLEIYNGTQLVASFQGACLRKAIPLKVPDFCWIRVWQIEGAGAYKIRIKPYPTYKIGGCK